MTPLQQAAQALIVHWTNARLDDFRMVGCVQNLRTALADEQAQPASSSACSRLGRNKPRWIHDCKNAIGVLAASDKSH